MPLRKKARNIYALPNCACWSAPTEPPLQKRLLENCRGGLCSGAAQRLDFAGTDSIPDIAETTRLLALENAWHQAELKHDARNNHRLTERLRRERTDAKAS